MQDIHDLTPAEVMYDGEGTFTLRFEAPGAAWEERLVVYLDDAASGHGNPGWAWSGAADDEQRPDGQALSVAEAIALVGPEHAPQVIGISRDFLADLNEDLRALGPEADMGLQSAAAFLAQEIAEAERDVAEPDYTPGL